MRIQTLLVATALAVPMWGFLWCLYLATEKYV